jgi:Xaa-Pro aminopeptidase
MLTAGHVVTVEPGVYLPDHGGVRIEDTVLVTADGCRTLTLAPKAPTPPAPASPSA